VFRICVLLAVLCQLHDVVPLCSRKLRNYITYPRCVSLSHAWMFDNRALATLMLA
jgi:hypothetical protein